MRRTDPADSRFADNFDLAEALPQALRSAAALAELARESARRALAMRAGAPDPTDQLARDPGAPGDAIGHTGPARALIFAPGSVPPHAKALLHGAGFRQMIRFRPTAQIRRRKIDGANRRPCAAAGIAPPGKTGQKGAR